MKVKITVTLDEDTLEKVKRIAKKESRTVSSQINKIIRDCKDDE